MPSICPSIAGEPFCSGKRCNVPVVNKGRAMKFYGEGLPGVDPANLGGKLIVIEGADGSGRSTQMEILKDCLEGKGHATVNVGLRRSSLVSEELNEAKQGNVLGEITRSLFYATDFADQLENRIIPALKAGSSSLPTATSIPLWHETSCAARPRLGPLPVRHSPRAQPGHLFAGKSRATGGAEFPEECHP